MTQNIPRHQFHQVETKTNAIPLFLFQFFLKYGLLSKKTELKEVLKSKCTSCSLEDVTIPTITRNTSRRHNEAHTYQAIFSAWVPELCVCISVYLYIISCLFRLCVLSSPVRSRKNNHKHYMCLFLKGIILFYALLPKGQDSSRIG